MVNKDLYINLLTYLLTVTNGWKRHFDNIITRNHSEETQTLRAGCSKAELKISPSRRPLSRGRGTDKI